MNANMEASEITGGPRRTHWAGAVVLVMCGVIGMFQIAKMAVAMLAVQTDIGLGLVAAGWATSIVTAVGAVAGIAAGAVIDHLDARRVLIAGLVIGVLGGLGLIVVDHPWLFLFLRLFEGLGYLIICVVAPVLLYRLSSERHRALMLAVWGCFVPAGITLMALFGPYIVATSGWRVLFGASAALLGALAVLVAITIPVEVGLGSRTTSQRSLAREMAAGHVEIYRSAGPMLLGLVFACFVVMSMALIAFLPMYLEKTLSLSPQVLGLIISASAASSLVGVIVAASVAQRRGLAGVLMIASFLIMCMSAAAIYGVRLSRPAVTALCVMFYIPGGFVPSIAFSLVPGVARTPARVGLTTGLLVQAGNIATLIGPPVMGALVSGAGWSAAGFLFGGATVIALIAFAALMRRLPRPATTRS